MKKVLLIIPAYNEEKNILSVYNIIKKFNDKNNKKYDTIIINDGSTDNTETILLKNNIPHITLLKNLGIGGCMQTGYKYAYENNYDIAVQFDGDNQHDINYVNELINNLKDNINCVIGSRFLSSKNKFRSTFFRRIGIRIISSEIKLFTKQKITDPTSGFRCVDKKIIKYFSNNYPLEYPEPISNVMILKEGFNLKEIPVKMKERKKGFSSIRTWKTVYYMVNVILSIFMISIRRRNK